MAGAVCPRTPSSAMLVLSLRFRFRCVYLTLMKVCIDLLCLVSPLLIRDTPAIRTSASSAAQLRSFLDQAATVAAAEFDLSSSFGREIVEVPAGQLFFPDKDLKLACRLLLETSDSGGATSTELRELHTCVTDNCGCAGVFYKEYGAQSNSVVLEVGLNTESYAGELDLRDLQRYTQFFQSTRPDVKLTYSNKPPSRAHVSNDADAEEEASRADCEFTITPVASFVTADEFAATSHRNLTSAMPFNPALGIWRLRFRPSKAVKQPFVYSTVRLGVNSVRCEAFESRTKPSGWLVVRNLPVWFGDTTPAVEATFKKILEGVRVKAVVLRRNAEGSRYGATPEELRRLHTAQQQSADGGSEDDAAAAKRACVLGATSVQGKIVRLGFVELSSRGVAKTAADLIRQAVVGRAAMSTEPSSPDLVISQVISLKRNYDNDKLLLTLDVSPPSSTGKYVQQQQRPGGSSAFRFPSEIFYKVPTSSSAAAPTGAAPVAGVSSTPSQPTTVSTKRTRAHEQELADEWTNSSSGSDDGSYDSLDCSSNSGVLDTTDVVMPMIVDSCDAWQLDAAASTVPLVSCDDIVLPELPADEPEPIDLPEDHPAARFACKAAAATVAPSHVEAPAVCDRSSDAPMSDSTFLTSADDFDWSHMQSLTPALSAVTTPSWLANAGGEVPPLSLEDDLDWLSDDVAAEDLMCFMASL